MNDGTADTGTIDTSTTTTTDAGTTTTTTAALTGEQLTSLFSGLDPETTGWVQNKGWFGTDFSKADLAKALPEVFKSYRGMEKLSGGRIFAPKDINDKEGWSKFYNDLGRPKDVSGYGVELPEGGNKDFLDGMLQAFHEAGLSTAQAQAIVKRSGDLSSQISTEAKARAEQEYSTKAAAEVDALKSEWGPNADRNFAAGQRAVQAFNLDKDMLDKMERAIGTKPLLSFLSAVGLGLTEDRGAGAEGGGSPLMQTVEQARARLDDLKNDAVWVKRYLDGGAAEAAEYNKLINIVAGG